MSTYFVRTNQNQWGIGTTEREALKNAHYTRRVEEAYVCILSEPPEDLRLNGWGDATWSNASCVVTEAYEISRDGSRTPVTTKEGDLA